MSMLLLAIGGFIGMVTIAWIFSAISDPALVDEEEARRAGNL